MNYPGFAFVNGTMYDFDRIAPITGDGIYTTQRSGARVHAIVYNPGAFEHQMAYLQRQHLEAGHRDTEDGEIRSRRQRKRR